MTKLREFAKVEFSLKHGNLKTMKVLHTICFNNEGYSTGRRKDLLNFDGFGFDKDSELYAAKLNGIKSIDLPDLFAVCHVLDLNYIGDSEEVDERILRFLNDCKIDKDLNVDEEQEEDVDNPSNDKEDERRKEVKRRNKIQINDEEDVEDEEDFERKDDERGSFGRRRRSEPFALTFKDVEDSIKCYDGKSKENTQFKNGLMILKKSLI
ncbi:protein DEK-like [Onthophagus taurus]|uniref:protein DEK-like n=1 Tax=Onthophagus taurus TaxID=166361 RepID=UPI0039BE0006